MATKPKKPILGLAELSKLSASMNSQDSELFDTLPLDKVYSKEQPRKKFQKIEELAQSIKELGQLQPIIVNDDGKGGYVIEQGERRYRACKLAGITTIRAVIKGKLGDADRILRQLAENVQRDDMTIIELANSIHALVFSGMTIRDVARKLGKKESYVSVVNAVAELPPSLLELADLEIVKDPVALRKLGAVYADYSQAIDEQIERWKFHPDETDDDSDTPKTVSRSQVLAFIKTLERPVPVQEKAEVVSPLVEPEPVSVREIAAERPNVASSDRNEVHDEGTSTPVDVAPVAHSVPEKNTAPAKPRTAAGEVWRVFVTVNGLHGYLVQTQPKDASQVMVRILENKKDRVESFPVADVKLERVGFVD